MRHFRQFFFHNDFRQEVASDVISGVVVQPTRMDVRMKCGDSRSNRSQDIRGATQFVVKE